GPYQFPEKLIPVIILNALEGRTLPIYGDGKNVRDWIYVDDHSSALEAVFTKGKAGEVYNIGADEEMENIEIVKLICSILDELKPAASPYSELIEFVKDRPGHDKRYAIDSSKIHKELGWSPDRNFEDALRDTVEWYLRSVDWCDRVRSGEYRSYYADNYGKR
ncbi:MAG: GDP-mannose 4,6-dehydratase, partial [Deltaproteobacteria bacterium]|nr:GDP-mannose 4,6-dehydratase [Deltaproteobacteria bacterium]